jgi:hypothetical protein
MIKFERVLGIFPPQSDLDSLDIRPYVLGQGAIFESQLGSEEDL